MAKFTYTVWGLDVWGNASDGWETNDRWREGKVVIDDNWNDAEVIKALFDAGYLNTAGARHFIVGGDEFMLTVDRTKNGRPLLTLEREVAGGKARKPRGGKARSKRGGGVLDGHHPAGAVRPGDGVARHQRQGGHPVARRLRDEVRSDHVGQGAPARRAVLTAEDRCRRQGPQERRCPTLSALR